MIADDLTDLLSDLPLRVIGFVFRDWLEGHEDADRCESCGRTWDGGCIAWELVRDLQRQAEVL